MITKPALRSATRLLVAGTGLAPLAWYATYASLTWIRYGHPPRAGDDERDEFLDSFMPDYEVVERHHIRVCAPAPVTLAAAREQNLFELPLVRAILRGRELCSARRSASAFSRAVFWNRYSRSGGACSLTFPKREVVVGAHHQTVGTERQIPGAAARRVRGISRTRVCEDCVDTARRHSRRNRFSIPHRNAGHCD